MYRRSTPLFLSATAMLDRFCLESAKRSKLIARDG
jgi:hypothetical protein